MAMIPAPSMGAAKREARDRAQLTGVLKQCNVHADVIKYLCETLGTVSVSDFFGLVKEATYEDELVQLVIEKIDEVKGNPLQASRLRAA